MSTPSHTQSSEELIEVMRGLLPSDRNYALAKDFIEFRYSERLIRETRFLKWATWGLVMATAGLILSTIAPLFLKCGGNVG